MLLTVTFALLALVRTAGVPSSVLLHESDRRGTRQKFVLVVVIEVVALNVAWNVLLAMRRLEYAAPAVAIIVGLHFVPLAHLLRRRVFYVPAVVMTGAGVLAAFTLWNAFCCLCCALALWAAVSLATVNPQGINAANG